MGRSSYLAPGVYVEEVPSARQPIAGVGTNTVAFIGCIPDNSIWYPVPNPDFDPVTARVLSDYRRLKAAEKDSKNKDTEELDAAAEALQARLDDAAKPSRINSSDTLSREIPAVAAHPALARLRALGTR